MRLLSGFFAGILLTVFCTNLPKNSGEWSGWVQAFGSIGAILVAVWVLQQQNNQSIRRANEEVEQIILSLRDEAVTLLGGFRQINAASLMANPEGPYVMRIPVSDAAFVIYNHTASQVGKIKNDELRAQIVITYARAFGFVRSLTLNNSLVGEYEDRLVEQARDKAAYGPLVEDKLRQLTDYGPKLRRLYLAAEAEVEKLALMVAKEIHVRERR